MQAWPEEPRIQIRDTDREMFATRITLIVNWATELERLVADGQSAPTAR